MIGCGWWSFNSRRSRAARRARYLSSAPAALFTAIDCQITMDFIWDLPNPGAAAHMGEARMDLSRHNHCGRQPASLLTDWRVRLRPNVG